jgi:hypothetical protein
VLTNPRSEGCSIPAVRTKETTRCPGESHCEPWRSGDHLLDPHSGLGLDVFGVEHRPGTVRVVDAEGLTHVFAEDDTVDVVESPD